MSASTPHLSEALLQAAADGSLAAAERAAADAHLAACGACRADVAALRAIVAAARALPRDLAPERDLWGGVQARIAAAGGERARWRRWALPLAALLVLAAGLLWWRTAGDPDAWRIATVAGAPRVGGAPAAPSRWVAPGDWLETGSGDALRVQVGRIGTVELAEGTRARLLAAGPAAHRLALERGTIAAVINAPPRLFVVETPSGVATDLGCAYTLALDSAGRGVLRVTEGWVELARGGRVVVVPYATSAELRPGFGPGTPWVADAPPGLRAALAAFDFGDGGPAAVRAALAAARPADGASVLNLLMRSEGALRAAAYDRLALLVPPPPGVTRAGVLALDPAMLDRWWDRIAPPVLVPEDTPAPPKKKRLRLIG